MHGGRRRPGQRLSPSRRPRRCPLKLDLEAHHTSFPIRNLEISAAFYEGVLGLEEIPRPSFGFRGKWYRAGACEVHLIEVPEGAPVTAAPTALSPIDRHAAFRVRDYDQALAHFRSHGIEVLETSRDNGQMWVQDPDGHILEFLVPRA